MVVGWMSLGGGGPLGCSVLHALGYYTPSPTAYSLRGLWLPFDLPVSGFTIQ